MEQSSPFKQAVLSPEECYILDNGKDGIIFVWKGRLRSGAVDHWAVGVNGRCNFSVRLPPNRPKGQQAGAQRSHGYG